MARVVGGRRHGAFVGPPARRLPASPTEGVPAGPAPARLCARPFWALGKALPGILLALALAAATGPAAGQAPQQQPPGVQAPASGEDRPPAHAARPAAAGNLVGHGGPIKAVRIDIAAGRALTGSFDYAMTAWDISGPQPRELVRFEDHDGAVNAVAFVPGGDRALSAGDDGMVSVWDIGSGRLVHRFAGHSAKVTGLAVSDDGRWAASASWDRTARIWDLAQLAPGPVLSGHQGPVNAVAFSAGGAHVFTASYDGSIGAYQRVDGSFERPVHKHGWGINVLERLPGTDQLVFGSINGSAGIVDASNGEVVVELEAHERPVLALAVLEKPSLIATGSAGGVIRVARAADGAVIEEHQNPYGPVWALAFTSQGRSIYYGGLDDFATLWHVRPRQPFEPLDNPFPRRFQQSGDSDDPAAQGRIQFARKCSICHTLTPDGANRAGPTLYGLFGRRIGTLPGYPYSDALKKLDIVWTEETVSLLFELGPDELTPGSKMPLQKMTDKAQRDALVAYLKAATAPAPVDGGNEVGQGSEAKGGTR
ncbi:MAG: c-type cytochrome [Hyphomicrobiaceae bacterium]|nr:c-type cytochrome [Hyphomicrobiaceae bacterium]